MKHQTIAQSVLLAYGILNVFSFVLPLFLFFDWIPGINILLQLTLSMTLAGGFMYLLFVIPAFALPFAAAASVKDNGVWLPAASLLMPLADLAFCLMLFCAHWEGGFGYYVKAIVRVVVDLIVTGALAAYFVCRKKRKRKAVYERMKKAGIYE